MFFCRLELLTKEEMGCLNWHVSQLRNKLRTVDRVAMSDVGLMSIRMLVCYFY